MFTYWLLLYKAIDCCQLIRLHIDYAVFSERSTKMCQKWNAQETTNIFRWFFKLRNRWGKNVSWNTKKSFKNRNKKRKKLIRNIQKSILFVFSHIRGSIRCCTCFYTKTKREKQSTFSIRFSIFRSKLKKEKKLDQRKKKSKSCSFFLSLESPQCFGCSCACEAKKNEIIF